MQNVFHIYLQSCIESVTYKMKLNNIKKSIAFLYSYIYLNFSAYFCASIQSNYSILTYVSGSSKNFTLSK